MKLEVVFKDGRKETFDGVVSYNVLKQFAKEEPNFPDVAQTPTEGKLFKVDLLEINESYFEEPRNDPRQEQTRKIIQQAFVKVKRKRRKYASLFYTMIPERKWQDSDIIYTAEYKAYAKDLGGHMGDWVEQALEWAQRLSNGESWEAVCNCPDTAKWYRVIEWDNDYRMVGGSRYYNYTLPASYIWKIRNINIDHAVPLVVIRK